MFAASLAIKQYIANRTTPQDFDHKYGIEYDSHSLDRQKKLVFTRGAKQDVCVILCDTFLLTTACVLAILTALSAIRIAPAAAYALFGISGAISIAWIVMAVKSRGIVFTYSKNLLIASCRQSPQIPQMAANDTAGNKVLDDAQSFMSDHCRAKEFALREALFGRTVHLPTSPGAPLL